MDKQALADITVFNKYARFNNDANRRENWEEIVTRNANMHKEKYPYMSEEIDAVYEKFVFTKRVLPSMRSLQFGGRPILMAENRIFNCFDIDTEFVTSEGLSKFSDYSDGSKVSVLTHTGEYKPAVVRKYGEQELNLVEFKRGPTHLTSVKVTSNHRWLLRDGSITTDLKVGDKLLPLQPVFECFDYNTASIEEQLYWCYGFIYGDGSIVNKGKPSIASMVRLCGDKSKYLPNFTNVGFPHSYPPSCGTDPIVYTGKYLKELPDVGISTELIRAFVAGYLDADGSKGTQLQIQASDPVAQEFIRTMFPVAGVFITSESEIEKETNYGYSKAVKFCLTKRFTSSPPHLFTVISITPISKAEVWCLEVEDNQSFVLGKGMVTGNCAYAPAESTKFFSELMFLLLGGTGMGYSVQRRHTDKLPKIKTPESDGEYKYQVQDSIVGWSDAVKVVCKAFFNAGTLPIFDYRDIRDKGAELITTGGQAPGPEPLRICIELLTGILRKAVGRKLEPIEVHDMACVIADAVLAGGIRRAAMISLFDRDDEAMLTCKAGEWYIHNPARGRANNSAVLPRGEVTEEEFKALMKRVEDSGCGEPGVYWTNNKDWGTNPCCEIALRPYQMCNLTEINAGAIKNQKEFNQAAEAASFIGTLQAGYTDFHYLNPKWKIACEKDALLGVSMTGIASGTVEKLDMNWAAECVIDANITTAKKLGIRQAARTTCVKPAGTTSLVLGTSSGIHAWHADYYIRRMRAGKDEALAQYMLKAAPGLVEQDVNVPHQVVLSFPQKAPEGATVRTEPMMNLLERVKAVSTDWVSNGHVDGINQHNVSCTISVKNDEWAVLTKWMWDNREHYNGISVLPYFGAAAYPQLPFEDIDEATYLKMLPLLESVDISKVFEEDGQSIDLAAELACSGGACEITF